MAGGVSLGDVLPVGWRWTSLGKVCEQDKQSVKATDPDYAGLPYLGLEHVESQTGRLLVDRDEALQGETKSNNFRFSASHVLYGKLRPYLNKVALPHFAGRCSTEIVPLRPAADVERRWLAWLLRHEETVRYAMRGKTGSRMPRASMDGLMELPVAVPPPRQQREIVMRLEGRLQSVERARCSAEAMLSALEAMPAALLRDTFRIPERERERE